MPTNRMGRVAFLEKLQGGEDDWSPYERQWLDLLALLSGIDLRRWPCYPLIAHPTLDDIERRGPSYVLWWKWHALTQYCKGGITLLYQAGRAYQAQHGTDDLPFEIVQATRKEYAATQPAQDLLRDAVTPVYTDFPGDIQSKRDSMPCIPSRVSSPSRSTPLAWPGPGEVCKFVAASIRPIEDPGRKRRSWRHDIPIKNSTSRAGEPMSYATIIPLIWPACWIACAAIILHAWWTLRSQ
jgi:hypothetical protein